MFRALESVGRKMGGQAKGGKRIAGSKSRKAAARKRRSEGSWSAGFIRQNAGQPSLLSDESGVPIPDGMRPAPTNRGGTDREAAEPVGDRPAFENQHWSADIPVRKIGCRRTREADRNVRAPFARAYGPMQNKCFSERRKRWPWEMASDAWHFSPMEFLAITLNSSAASMIVVSPSSERK